MSNRLRSYVRRTLIAQARDYNGGKRRTAQSTRDALQDALRGTNMGWWNDLIYTADILERFNRNRTEVAEVIREFLSETGAEMWQNVRVNDKTTYADLIASTGRKHTFEDYKSEGSRGRDAEAAVLALQFAVEFLAGEVARDLCPDL